MGALNKRPPSRSDLALDEAVENILLGHELLLALHEAAVEGAAGVDLPATGPLEHPVAGEGAGLLLVDGPVHVDLDAVHLLAVALTGNDGPLAPLGDVLDVPVGHLDGLNGEGLALVGLRRDVHISSFGGLVETDFAVVLEVGFEVRW